jgi:hypothetical protein
MFVGGQRVLANGITGREEWVVIDLCDWNNGKLIMRFFLQ